MTGRGIKNVNPAGFECVVQEIKKMGHIKGRYFGVVWRRKRVVDWIANPFTGYEQPPGAQDSADFGEECRVGRCLSRIPVKKIISENKRRTARAISLA
jgi:hypothetical protein